jgi:ATP-binding cassette subfamily G (WHITE) protein 1
MAPQVIKETKLSKCADTIIGGTDPIYVMKGISGGERKRVALATELLRAPEIIFLDEPTSGLDSVMSESVVATLRELASGGRMVVTSIHCPSSDLMRYFTHLVLLTYDGRLAYHGERAKAVEHFQHLG